MSNPTFTVTVKGMPVTFTSAFERLDEAYRYLNESELGATPNDFVVSLLQAARARKLSGLQVAWIHKLATDRKQPQVRPVVAGLNLLPIIEMMSKAAGAQKRAPRIVLQVAPVYPDSGKLVLAMAGPKSRYPGTVTVTNGWRFSDERSTYFGRIMLDGSVQTSRDWRADVEQKLRDLAANPAAVAAQHGVATGSCCFCAAPLSTAESRSVGYGPICASKFGLPWGDTSVADAADAEAKSALLDPKLRLAPGDLDDAMNPVRCVNCDGPLVDGLCEPCERADEARTEKQRADSEARSGEYEDTYGYNAPRPGYSGRSRYMGD